MHNAYTHVHVCIHRTHTQSQGRSFGGWSVALGRQSNTSVVCLNALSWSYSQGFFPSPQWRVFPSQWLKILIRVYCVIWFCSCFCCTRVYACQQVLAFKRLGWWTGGAASGLCFVCNPGFLNWKQNACEESKKPCRGECSGTGWPKGVRCENTDHGYTHLSSDVGGDI